jgi:hypothetical protein
MKRLAPLAVALLVLAGCGGSGKVSVSDQDKATSEALLAFNQAQDSGKDLSNGPCLAEHLPGLPDWAADIAHDPREPVDNQAANQCSSFQAGQTHHFVELTPEGQLIRTR